MEPTRTVRPARTNRLRIWVATLGLIGFYLVVGLTLRYPVNEAKIPVTGDEHHYLTQAVSLINDGDLVVLNNYESGDYVIFFGTVLDPSLWNLIGDNGYSGHSPGVGLVVVAGWWAAGWFGVLFMLAIAMGGTFLITAATFARILGGRLSTAALLVLTSGFTALPLFPYSHTLYPETFMAPLVATAVWLAVIHLKTSVAWRRTAAAIAAISVCGLSMGLHPKYFAVLVGVTLYFVGLDIYHAWKSRRIERLPAALSYVVVAGVWLGLFSWFHMLMWDVFHPAGWFAYARSAHGVSPSRAFIQLFDLLFGSQNGLFFMVPLTLLIVAFLVRAARSGADRLEICLGLFVVMVLVSIVGLSSFSVDWHAGDSPLGRYAAPVVPLLLLTNGYVVAKQPRSGARQLFLLVLVVIALLQTLAYVATPMSFRPRTDGGGGVLAFIADRVGGLFPERSWFWSAATPSSWSGVVLWFTMLAFALWLFARDGGGSSPDTAMGAREDPRDANSSRATSRR